MALKMYGVCVVCSVPGLRGRVYSAPSCSVAGGLPRRGPFIAAARGSSMTLGGPHCTCMVTEIVPTGYMFSKRGHMWPPNNKYSINMGHCTQRPIHGSWWSSFVYDVYMYM